MAPQPKTSGRDRGEIETLPSGSLRVKVYAGIGRERLRAQVALPVVWGGWAGLSGSWVVGYLLLQAGIHTTSAAPQKPAIHAPMMGSLTPFTVDTSVVQADRWGVRAWQRRPVPRRRTPPPPATEIGTSA